MQLNQNDGEKVQDNTSNSTSNIFPSSETAKNRLHMIWNGQEIHSGPTDWDKFTPVAFSVLYGTYETPKLVTEVYSNLFGYNSFPYIDDDNVNSIVYLTHDRLICETKKLVY